jgi:hypothetical protein
MGNVVFCFENRCQKRSVQDHVCNSDDLNEGAVVCISTAQLVSGRGPISEEDGHFRATVSSVVTMAKSERREEVIGYYFEFALLYPSPDIIRQLKSRRMKWAGHVARMGEGKNVYRVLVVKPEGKSHLENQGVDGSMGSKWTLGRSVGGCVKWTHLAQDRDRCRAVVNAAMNLLVLAPRI